MFVLQLQMLKFNNRERVIEFAIEKKDGECPYWKRLVKHDKNSICSKLISTNGEMRDKV